MNVKKFKVRMNPAVFYFEIFYAIFFGVSVFDGKYNDALVIAGVGVFIYGYLMLLRPYKYEVNRKTLTIYKRIGQPKEINLMSCETICDPVPKLTRVLTRPHALELYTEKKKRILLVPKDRVEFTATLLRANKRLHVQVKEFAEKSKSVAKKQRRERKNGKKEISSDAE